MTAAEKLPFRCQNKFFAGLFLVSLLFNTISILSNFLSLNFDGSESWARILVACVEAAVIVIYYVVWAGYLFWAGYNKRQRGEVAGWVAQFIFFGSTFSVTKGLKHIQNVHLFGASEWQRQMSKDGARTRRTCTWCIQVLWRVCMIILSFLALLLKLAQVGFVEDTPFNEYTVADVLALGNFLNAMLGLYIPNQVKTETIYQFLFGGSDGLLQYNEQRCVEEFQECIFFRLCKKGGFLGVLHILTLFPPDLQSILLEPPDEELPDIGEVDDDL